ncbi:MAG: amino acid ABC transporter permease [Sporichthyaceae bacterium]
MSTVLYDAPGPRTRRRILIASALTVAASAVFAAAIFARLADQGQFDGQKWRPILDPGHPQFGDLWRFLGGGLRATLNAAAAAMALSVFFGTLFAVLRLQAAGLSTTARPGRGRAARIGRRVGVGGYRWGVVATLELLRGIPVVIAVVYVSRVFPEFGIDLPTMWYLVIGLTAYNSVVIGEIIRAGVAALPRGQTEAALAVGLTRAQTLRLVLLPQSLRIMAPALISQLVVVLKDTSLGFFIAYEELLRRGNIAIQTLQNPLQLFFVVGLIFISINYVLSRLAVFLERRVNAGSRQRRA